jgi:hypothetical protein
MRRYAPLPLLATLALVFASWAAAAPPRPEPHPSAKGRSITWVPYTYAVPDTTGRFLMRCSVPVSGKRRCWVVGAAP